MPKKAGVWFILMILGAPILGVTQDFSRSPGMLAFNEGRYQEAVSAILQWLNEHPEDVDIANYYLGEAYYNLGMAETQVGRCREFFRKADRVFQEVLKVPGVKQRYPKIYFAAQMKRGWCDFRRAETGEQPEVLLGNAYRAFRELDDDAPDSLKIQAMFMAGESRFWTAVEKKYEIFASDGDVLAANELISYLNDAISAFSSVARHPTASGFQKLLAQTRRSEALMELGIFYAGISEQLFQDVADTRKKESPIQTALSYLNQADFANIPELSAEAGRSPLKEFYAYLESMRLLEKFLVTDDFEDKKRFLEKIREASLPELEKEIAFRLGNADHNTSRIEDNESFFNLYQNDERSYYFRALSGPNRIREAHFWLGAVQFVVNSSGGIENLHSFIQNFGQSTADPRINVLLDYARYWRGMLFLEAYRQNRNRMADLRNFLADFRPATRQLAGEVALLEKMVRLEMGEDVWADVLEGGASPDWFAEAFRIIQYLLRRAAIVVGRDRLHYLQQLNRIFYYTQFKKPNETVFYQGIAKSLEAEIQGDENDKMALFRESAQLLEKVTGDYQFEAQYIRGRSLFFAGDYEQAKGIFRKLINEKHSLRSLYYFAEILRLNNMGNAARQCYAVIQEKTETLPDGKYWYLNSEAAAKLCLDKVDGSNELAGLDYRNVVFPERLFQLSYEQLADRRYLLMQFLNQSIRLLKRFSLPKKTFYPLAESPKTSIFAKHSLKNLPFLFDELLRRETSVLEIFVLGPKTSIKLALNNQSLRQVGEGHYLSDQRNVGEIVHLNVSAPGYYPLEENIQVRIPGKQILYLPLTEQIRLSPSSAVGLPFKPYSFAERLDRNIILLAEKKGVPNDAELVEDLSANLFLRDVAFHPKLQNYLVVDARAGKSLIRYNASGNRMRQNGRFQLNFDGYDLDSLRSPEGLAIDSEGNLYLTDFAVHRVVVFDGEGQYRFHFGTYGQNVSGTASTLTKPRFTFPTRIAVEEDPDGIEVTLNGDQTRVFRQTFVWVADRFGIHRCTANGQFVETVLTAEQLGLGYGEIYTLAVDGYGKNARLYVAVRSRGDIRAFSATLK